MPRARSTSAVNIPIAPAPITITRSPGLRRAPRDAVHGDAERLDQHAQLGGHLVGGSRARGTPERRGAWRGRPRAGRRRTPSARTAARGRCGSGSTRRSRPAGRPSPASPARARRRRRPRATAPEISWPITIGGRMNACVPRVHLEVGAADAALVDPDHDLARARARGRLSERTSNCSSAVRTATRGSRHDRSCPSTSCSRPGSAIRRSTSSKCERHEPGQVLDRRPAVTTTVSSTRT